MALSGLIEAILGISASGLKLLNHRFFLVIPVLILTSSVVLAAPPLQKDGGVVTSRRAHLSTEHSFLNGGHGTMNATTDVLLAFRRGLTMDFAEALQSWNITTHPNFCNWAGVSCTQAGYISSLDLSDKGLVGGISPSVGSLVSLRYLALGGNNFSGTIPPALGSLQELIYLNLSSNSLSGTIPAEISNCSLLRQASFSKNFLSGEVPLQLGKLSRISLIDLSQNNLGTSIPSWLGNCSSLQQLHLQDNNLTGIIPPELGNLDKLFILDLSYNQLGGQIPESLVKCSLLETLELTSNYVTGPILPELSSLRQLGILHLSSNYFHGDIPRTLGNLSSLYSLEVGGDAPLGGSIPSELGKLKNLYWFEISSTSITGNIPPELGNLTNVLHFSLKSNRLTGTIPESLGNLNNAILIDLGFNGLAGTIPPSLGDSGNLGWLDLQWNNLISGRIPSSFQNLTRIWFLSLSHNMLSGPVIPELGNLTTLGKLSLDTNAFTGELPSTFVNLSRLEVVNLNNNKLSGAIPPGFFSAMAHARECTLHGNNFSGRISPGIGDMVMMEMLDLSYNSLSGPLPVNIIGCKNLYFLSLSNNQLTGELPVGALESLHLLDSFSVANNSFVGVVPSPVGAFAKFNSSVYVGNPGLCGPPLAVNCSNTTRNQVSCSAISATCHQVWFSVLVIGGFVALLVGFLAVKCLCCPKTKLDEPVLWSAVDFTTTLTPETLQSATDGFSEANIVGVGGESTVYKAVLPSQIFVIKVLHPNVSDNTTRNKNVQASREVQVLGNIRHRNLVSFYGFYAKANMKALLVEYVPKGDLHSHLHPRSKTGAGKCSLDFRTRLKIIVGVAHALSYLHHECAVPVIHRDLKPANILLEDDFNPKVSDFGISKLVKPGYDNEASASTLWGTTGYIPPEYGAGSKISTAGDVYSYGILVLEILTGKMPHAISFMFPTDGALVRDDTIVSWVSRAFPHRIQDILDDALICELPHHKQYLQMLLRVGLLCTLEDPKRRPSMRDVQNIFMMDHGDGQSASASWTRLSADPDLEFLLRTERERPEWTTYYPPLYTTSTRPCPKDWVKF